MDGEINHDIKIDGVNLIIQGTRTETEMATTDGAIHRIVTETIMAIGIKGNKGTPITTVPIPVNLLLPRRGVLMKVG